MGHKKGKHPKRSKPPKLPKNATGGGGAVSSTTGTDDLGQEQSKTEPLECMDDLGQKQSKAEPLECTDSASIMMELTPAITAYNRRQHTEALDLVQEVSLRHLSCPVVHCFLAFCYLKVASPLDDKNVDKQELLKNAVMAAKRAVILSPNSISFAICYANTLYTVSNNDKDYEEVVQECERGLSIVNPTDPAKDTAFILKSDEIIKNMTVERRIECVRQQLHKLIENSKIASADNGKKVPLIQTRRSNESKESSKMAEEGRRKEIQERVEVTRLLQQNWDSVQSQKDEEKVSQLTRLEKRRKNANIKNINYSVSRTEQLQSYLKSMSNDEKLGLFETRICDLRAHVSSLKDRLAEELLSEAVRFAEKNNTWKYWACCCCDKKFIDSVSHLHHLKQEHIGNLSPELQSAVPVEVDARWVEMIGNGLWKPVDTSAAVRIIGSQSKCDLDNLVDKDSSDGNMDCPSESSSNPVTLPSWPVLCLDDQKWPISNDSERAEILKKIHDMLQLLLEHNYVAQNHITSLMQYAMGEIPDIMPASQLLIQSLCQSPLGLCFLGVPQLEGILQFLQQLRGLDRDSKTVSSRNDALDGNQGYEIYERIVFCGDPSCPFEDERLLRVEFMPYAYDDSVVDDGPSATSAVGHHEAAVLPDSNPFLYWLSSSHPTERLTPWTSLCGHTKTQGMKHFLVLEKESHLLQSLCEKKCEYLSCEEALKQETTSIKFEELVKLEEDASYVPQGYGSLLRKRQEELTGRNDDSISSSSRVELDVISNVLRESQSINFDQLGFEETETDSTCFYCDLKRGEDNKCKMQGYLHEEEVRIKIAAWEILKSLSWKLDDIDGRIMRSIANMKQLEIKLAQVSAHDYRLVMLPLLRTFMRAQLEHIVDKDATEKAEAAAEALLALEAEKNINKRGNQTKHTLEKSKNRKKKKDRRKQEGKFTDGNKQEVLQEDGEQPHFPVIDDDDYSNTLKQRELEADEKKLEEALEYQRQVENEAKQKQLAKQDEKTSEILQAEVAETITIGTRNDVVQTIETGNDGTRNDVVQTVEAQNEETRAVTFQNDEARDGARGEVAASTLAAAVKDDAAAEVSWMGVQISRTFVPLLEEALMHHPNLAVALASQDVALHQGSYERLGRVLQIFGQVANGETDESVLEVVHLILQDLQSLDLDVLWLDRRFAIAKRLLYHSQLVPDAAELEDQIAKAIAEIELLEDEHRIISDQMAEVEGDYSLLTSCED